MTTATLPEMKKADPVRVAFPPKLYQKAKKHAENHHISPTAYMREAVARRIEAEERRRQRERQRRNGD